MGKEIKLHYDDFDWNQNCGREHPDCYRGRFSELPHLRLFEFKEERCCLISPRNFGNTPVRQAVEDTYSQYAFQTGTANDHFIPVCHPCKNGFGNAADRTCSKIQKGLAPSDIWLISLAHGGFEVCATSFVHCAR